MLQFVDAWTNNFAYVGHRAPQPARQTFCWCRRVAEDELRAAFGSGWRIDSLGRGRFDINPSLGTPTAEAWLADVVRLAYQ